MDEPSTSSGSRSAGNELFFQISNAIRPDQWQLLGMVLELDVKDLQKIQRDANVHQNGFEFMVMQMLNKWKEKKNPREEELVPLLGKALNDIERKDIADRITYGGHLTDSSLQVIFNKMQRRQRKNFKHLQLPRSLWLQKKLLPLEELFMELTMKKKNTYGEELEEVINQRQMFNQLEGKIPRRILIEGHPGYGKTTLVAKLLSDWSNEFNTSQVKRSQIGRYISDKFDLVFLISLRNYAGELEQEMIKQCECLKENECDALNVIEKMQYKILLLLDGLDEINKSFTQSLFPVLERKKYYQMTVVVTCRTGFIPTIVNTNKHIKSLEIAGFEKHSLWDNRIQIKGISSEKRFEFLKKYLEVDIHFLKENLSKLNVDLNEIYECPLFLLLLGVLIQDGKVGLIRTKTELYKKITNFVINRSLDRKNLLGDQGEINIFDKGNNSYRNLFISFGKLCLEKLNHDCLIINECELQYSSDEKYIIKGFLSKEISFFKNEEEEHYEPIHKSFLEFFAAFYLYTLEKNRLLDKLFAMFCR